MSDAEVQPNTETPLAPPEPAPGETPAPEPIEAQEPTDDAQEAPVKGDGEGEAGLPADAEAKRKRAGGWQRKIERQERQIQLLTEQLARQTPAPAAPAPKEQTEADKATMVLDNMIEQRIAAKEQQRRQQAQIDGWQQRTSEVRAAHADYDDVVATLPVIPPDSALGLTLLNSERGPEIMYQLAKSGELAKVSRLHPLDAAREIGKLEAQLASSTATRKTNGAVTRTSAAPAPITPVTARGPSNVKPVEQMSYEEYRAWRDRQSKR